MYHDYVDPVARAFRVALALGLSLALGAGAYAQSPICVGAEEFCAENGFSFPASTNAAPPDPGNSYGCLDEQPNPAWFFMSSTQAGGITVNLSSSPAEDIDFAVWGPFSSLGDALGQCGSLGPPISCSYSSSATETANFNAGGPGEFFIMLVTNFSNNPTEISGTSPGSILGCNVCIAEGGTLSPPNQVGCLTNVEPIVVDQGGASPDPATFGYTMVVTDAAGTITQEFPGLTTLAPTVLGTGTFTVCGIAYELGTGEPASFVGLNFDAVSQSLDGPSPPYCGDASNNCATIRIVPDPVPTFVEDSVCIGAQAPDCPFIGGEYRCAPGAGSFTEESRFGCDSLVTYTIIPRDAIFVAEVVALCPGQVYTSGGIDYTAPGAVTELRPSTTGGCDTTAIVTLEERDVVAAVSPATATLTCGGGSIALSAAGSSIGPDVTYAWTGPTGPLGATTTTTIDVTQPGTYTLTVTRADPASGTSCTAQAVATILPAPTETDVPTLTGPRSLCVGEAGNFVAAYAGPYGPYSYEWFVVGNGSTLTQTGVDAVDVSWNAPGSPQLCVAARGSCGSTDTTCVTVTIRPNVSPDAGPDQRVCGLATSLDATPAGGTWRALAGPDGIAVVQNPNAASTEVSAAQPGRYAFVYEVGGACAGSDEVVVELSAPLAASGPSFACDPAFRTYTVSFELAGGTAPFAASPRGTFAGTRFTSGFIDFGTAYAFTFTDAYGCEVAVAGTDNCGCVSDAGSMPAAATTLCEGDPFAAGPAAGAVLDADDVGAYYLHDAAGASLGTVLATSADGTFAYAAPPITPGVSYYVSYVVGDAGPDGFPDPTDPCFAVSVGQPVRWEVAPTATATTVCDASAGTYALTVEVAGGTAPFTFGGGLALAGGPRRFTTVLPEGATYDFTVTDANGCTSPAYGGSADCDCVTAAGALPTERAEACTPDALAAGPTTGAVLEPDDVGVYLLHALGGDPFATELARSPDGVFAFAPPLAANTPYAVTYAAGDDAADGAPDPQDGCLAVSAPRELIWWEAETPAAGSDQTVCGLTATLGAGNAAGNWAAPAEVTLSDPTDPAATATASAFGTYELTWRTSAGASVTCTREDRVAVTFAEAPTASFTYVCDPAGASATVTIVVRGGLPPFNIAGLAAVATSDREFTTALPDGATFAFSVTDGNGCVSASYPGGIACDCVTRAPSLPSGAEVCLGEALSLPPATGGFADNDDVDEYQLYQGDATTVTNVLATAPTPDFPYSPAYLPGTTYYVAVVRGNDDGSGGVDASDPCAQRSAGVPVTWRPLPSIAIASRAVCGGATPTVEYTYSGTLPATLEYTFDGAPATEAIATASGEIALPTAGSFRVTGLRQNGGCDAAALPDDVEVVVEQPGVIAFAPAVRLCVADGGDDPAEVALADLLDASATPGGTWESPDAPGAIDGQRFDARGLAPGVYTLVYTLAPSPVCPGLSATMRVTTRDCACPDLTVLPPDARCNTDAFIALAGLLAEPLAGVWTVASAPAGTRPLQITPGGFADGTGADAGTYRLLFTLTDDAVAGCRDTVSVPVTLAAEPQVGSAVGESAFCEGTEALVELDALLVGAQPGGTWVPVSANAAAGLSGATVVVDDLVAGVYRYGYAIDAVAPCPDAQAEVTLVVNATPAADAGADADLTCADPTATIGTAGQAGLDYSWTLAGQTDVLGREPTLGVGAAGTYALTVVDAATGCAASDEVTVAASDEVPQVAADVSAISCAGEADAALDVTAIEGGAGPYTLFLNGERYVNQTSFFGLAAGAYELSVEDANGCRSEPLGYVIDEPTPVAAAILATVGAAGLPAGSLSSGDSVALRLDITAGRPVRIRWRPAGVVACDTCRVTAAAPASSVNLTATVTDEAGCTAEALLQLIVRASREVFFPTAFSPDGDDVNDEWRPLAQDGSVERIRSLRVFDRWGEQVYAAVDVDPRAGGGGGWDGRHRGEPLDAQVFVFVAEVEYADGLTETVQGDFTLLR